MDFINKAMGGDNSQTQGQGQNTNTNQGEQKQESGGFLSGLGDKMNAAAGGGKESEKNEDYLDKGIDAFQQHVMGQGAQDNESAVEQAKDEQISDFIRGKYKDSTGKEIPIEDKKTTFG